MTPHRTAIKLYFAEDTQVDPAKAITVFHRWIRDKTVEGLLIDAADYKHVAEGPAAMLVAHEYDYIIDLSEGRPGLTLVRKRPAAVDTLADDIADLLRKLVVAASAFALNPDPHPPVSFDTGALRIQVMDRLNYPHDAGTVAAVTDQANAALTRAFDSSTVTLTSATDDPRAPITLAASIANPPDLTTLYNNLQAANTLA